MPLSPRTAAHERARLAVLAAINEYPELWEEYVLKGGLALRYGYDSPRQSGDLDFSSLRSGSNLITGPKQQRLLQFCDLVDDGLEQVASSFDFTHISVSERTLSEELPVVMTEVRFADKADASHEDRVKMQVSSTDIICETMQAEIEGIPVHVPSLDDVLAEKLKSLLQQPVRKSVRSSDIYDIWFFSSRSTQPVDVQKITTFLKQKSAEADAIRPLTKSLFYDPEVQRYAASSYDALVEQLREGDDFPAFEDAFEEVLRFVDRLALPEEAPDARQQK